MPRMVLPKRLKAYLKEKIGWEVEANLRNRDFREGFFPHKPTSLCYLLPKTPERGEFHESSSLPVPPNDLWAGYGRTVEAYLASGKGDNQTIREILGQSGAALESAERILDFGCAAGRMIRWLQDVADACEIWGTDIWASAIIWCKQYLSPPFHFVTTTTSPHLPFEDRYFGLIYCGSVFTHIDDLADAWFLELRRILRPGGRLYVTIQDRTSIAILDKDPTNDHVAKIMRSFPEYEQFSRSDFGMFTLARSVKSHVFYDVDFLRRRLEPFFRTLSVTERAYGHQTAVLLERA